MEAEKAIEILRLFQAVVENNENQKAFEMAIKALEMQIRTDLDDWNEPPMGGFKEE